MKKAIKEWIAPSIAVVLMVAALGIVDRLEYIPWAM